MTKNQDPRIISLPNFTSSFKYGGQVYPYTRVGKDPSKGDRTNIPTQYIPLSFFSVMRAEFYPFFNKNGNNP
jgi:hypothetical protein